MSTRAPYRDKQSPLILYAVVVAAVVLALGVTSIGWPVIRYAPLSAIFVVVTASAWYGGRELGLLATVLAALGYAYLFLPPYWSLSVDDEQDVIHVALFVVVAGLISVLSGRLKQAEAENARLTAIIKGINEIRVAHEDERPPERNERVE